MTVTFLACVSSITASDLSPRTIEVLYTGNTLGELKPCGCALEEDQGGIERRAYLIKEIQSKEKNLIILDSGDSFKQPSRQGKIKAKFLMQSMGRMGYDAVAIGDKDLVYGNAFLGQWKTIPFVASNLILSGVDFIPKYRITILPNGAKVAIFALADPDLFYLDGDKSILVESPKEMLGMILPSFLEKEKPDLTILLTHMNTEKALSFLGTRGVDVIVNGNIETENDVIDINPLEKNGAIFVQSGPRGQKVGDLKITLKRSGELVFAHRMIKLDSHVNFDSEMVKLYKKYNEEIEDLFFASLAAKRKKNVDKVYRGETACKDCHKQAYKIWSKSRHGHAYSTLKKVDKAFDPECLICHTVGFNQPGGFISEVDTPGLENVQCEECHGSALDHVKSPKKGWSPNAKEACKKCHVKNHSPKFNFSTYWPKIKH
jgi:2',3'-cyclic-nucleotide 2'-phosphodiesterase (5'-nucleotidase family)